MANGQANQISVGIDGYNLAMPHGTGISTYGRTLASTLQEAGYTVTGVFGIDPGADPTMREVLFFDNLKRVQKPLSDQERRRNARQRNRIALNPWLRAEAVDVPLTGRVETAGLAEQIPAFDRLVSSRQLFAYAHQHFRYYGRFLPVRFRDPPPIMHWTYPIPVEVVGSRNIYTIHDLVPLRLPHTTLDDKVRYRALLAKCIERSAAICTISEASRADILAEFGADATKVTNVYQASPLPAGWPMQNADDDAGIIEGLFGLPRRGYFLFFGAVEPKKNIGRMLEAFLGLRLDIPLVIAGGRSWHSEGELALLPEGDELETERGKRIADRIIRVDHLPRQTLLRLIRGARAVLFPSLYEGFGLPILEAMQLGTPVLTSRSSSMPEVAGDAALYVDPYDTGSIAAALRRLHDDEALCAQLSAAGLRQADNFSAQRYQERLAAMYQSVLAAS